LKITDPHHSARRSRSNLAAGRSTRPVHAPVYVRILTGLAAICSVTAAAAAPSDLTGLSLEQLLNVEVASASKFPQKVSDAPSAVSIVTAAEIKAYGYRTLADVLQSIRGLYVTNDQNYSYLGARGFSRPGDYNTRILLLVDGYRLNDPIYGGGLIGTEFIVDVDLIERVEFVPGPGSAVYGSNAFFGVVNVVTRTGEGVGRTETSAEVASRDTTKARLSYGQRYANGLDMLVSATTYHRRGEDIYFPEFDNATTNGVAQDLDHDRSKQFFYKASYGAFSLETAYSSRTKGIPTAAFSQVFNDTRSETTDEQAFVDLKYHDRLSDTLQVNANVYAGRYVYDGSYVYPGALPPPTVLSNDESRGNWWGGELRFLSTALARHKLVFGAEYRNNTRQDQSNYDVSPSYVLYLDDKRNGSVSGIYAQDEYALSDRWTINAGARYDHIVQGTSENVLNPRLAVIYKPQAATTYKLLYGTAFRSPNVLEKYYGTVAGGYKQNPDLAPEKIKTVEAVLERYLSDDLRITGSVFWYQTKDLINLMQDPVDGLLVYRNIDQAEARGVELEAERRWTSGQRLRMSYTWQRVENMATHTELSNSPRQMVKLNYSAPVFANDWRAGLEAQYMGERSAPAGNTVGGRTLVNMTLVSGALARNLEVSASVYNVFDRGYGDVPSEEHFDSLDRSLNEIPQDGRSFRLKLTYGF
jgi:outer membrane receptor protein involved in Fe transport